MLNTLENLIKLARDRKSSPVEGSYTNKLLSDKSLSKAKVLEEVDELIEAVEENTNKIHEAADVIYHLLIFFEANEIKIEDVQKELIKREKWLSYFSIILSIIKLIWDMVWATKEKLGLQIIIYGLLNKKDFMLTLDAIIQ